MSDPFSVNDVLDAHDLLGKYAGNAEGLFNVQAPAIDPQFSRWRISARCTAHGPLVNIVTIPAWQDRPSEAAFVICEACLLLGIWRHLEPMLVVKLTSEEGTNSE